VAAVAALRAAAAGFGDRGWQQQVRLLAHHAVVGQVPWCKDCLVTCVHSLQNLAALHNHFYCVKHAPGTAHAGGLLDCNTS
jgi:hypothetical protein